jgi:hypothetical protein
MDGSWQMVGTGPTGVLTVMLQARTRVARPTTRARRPAASMPMEAEVSAKDVAEAHQKDVETQDKYGVDYRSY